MKTLMDMGMALVKWPLDKKLPLAVGVVAGDILMGAFTSNVSMVLKFLSAFKM